MTPAMNYKEATGVRARSDLTANRLPTQYMTAARAYALGLKGVAA